MRRTRRYKRGRNCIVPRQPIETLPGQEISLAEGIETQIQTRANIQRKRRTRRPNVNINSVGEQVVHALALMPWNSPQNPTVLVSNKAYVDICADVIRRVRRGVRRKGFSKSGNGLGEGSDIREALEACSVWPTPQSAPSRQLLASTQLILEHTFCPSRRTLPWAVT